MAEVHSTQADLFGAPIPETRKTCSKCGEAKPITEFHKCSQSSGGLHGVESYCKTCRRAVNNEHSRQCKEKHSEEVLGYTADSPVTHKVCTRCGEDKPLTDYFRCRANALGVTYRCKVCMKQSKIESQNRTPENLEKHKRRQQRSRLRNLFGMTPEQYEEMNARQNGLCAICGRPETSVYSRKGGEVKPKRLAVDHSHNTGKIRQLLCSWCNRVLGMMNEDPSLLRAAADYLERHAAIPPASGCQ